MIFFTLFPFKFLSGTTCHFYIYIAEKFKNTNYKIMKNLPPSQNHCHTFSLPRQPILLISRSIPTMHEQITPLPDIFPETGSLCKPLIIFLNTYWSVLCPS